MLDNFDLNLWTRNLMLEYNLGRADDPLRPPTPIQREVNRLIGLKTSCKRKV